MKPEAQDSGTDAGRSERARGAVLMLIGFGVGFAVCYLLVTPVMDSPSTVASPSAVSARVFTSPFLPLARRQEDGTYLMTYEYWDEDFRRALEEFNTSIFGMGGIIQSHGVFLQSQRVFYMEERLTMPDCAPSPEDWQQPRSLHLLDQRPAREFIPSTQ